MSPRLQKSQLDAWRSLLRGQALLIEQVERELAAADLPPLGWYDVLTELDKAGGRLRIHELADAVILSRSGLSRLLDRLEAAGLLQREPCENDRRGAYAAITSSGRDMLVRIWPVYERCLSEHFAPHLDRAAAGVIQSTLDGVTESIRGAGGRGV